MGCAESKLDNEDTLRRCKERRRLMKAAVYARHHLAAAHSDYCRSLRITGSALVTFASGEPLAVSHHTPAVLLRTPPSTIAANSKPPPQPPIPTASSHLPQSPPSPPIPTASSHHPQSPPSPPPISATTNHYHYQQPPPPIRRKKPMKLPHILSDSSLASSPPPPRHHSGRANSTYSTTPSQTSSVWNWDTFYPPPSPPNSDYFDQLHRRRTVATTKISSSSSSSGDDDDKSSIHTSYSNAGNPINGGEAFQNPFSGNGSKQFFDRASNHSSYSRLSENRPGQKKEQSLNPSQSDEGETEREEVQCSEWGDHDHYSSTTSSSDEDADEAEDLKSRSNFRTRSVKNEAADSGDTNVDVNFKPLEKPNTDDKSSVSWGDGSKERANSDRRIMVRHKDLAEIVAAINVYFVKAASAGDQVSDILETGRAQLDRSFKQLKSEFLHSRECFSVF